MKPSVKHMAFFGEVSSYVFFLSSFLFSALRHGYQMRCEQWCPFLHTQVHNPSLSLPPRLAFGGLLCFHTEGKPFCSRSVKNATGILIGIALTCRLSWLLWPFLQYWFFHSTNMVYLSICWCHLSFPWSMSYSFQSTYLLPPWFSLSPSIVLFMMLLVSSLLMLSFKTEKFLILSKSNLSIFPLVPWTLMSYIKMGA